MDLCRGSELYSKVVKLAKWPFPPPYFYLFQCDSSSIIEIIVVSNIKERFDSKVNNMTKTAYTIVAWIVLLWKL